MTTYKDIQRHTGLSLATISKYFNGGTVRNENRIALDSAVADLGYRVNSAARSLRKGRSYSIGVLLPALDNLFHMTMVAELERALRAEGVGLIVGVSSPDGRSVEFLLEKGVDGIIAVPAPSDTAALAIAAQDGIPLVLVDWLLDGVGVDAVTLNNTGAGRTAARHLLDFGHTDVALIGGRASISSLRARGLGFSTALEEAGITLTQDRIPLCEPVPDEAARATLTLLYSHNRPTALFTVNYELTLGALRAVSEAGLALGRDISLVGFDVGDLAGLFTPRITTLRQPTPQLARAAAEQILARLSSPRDQVAALQLDAELLIGGSVARMSPRPARSLP